jgi:hypothetical protein
MGHFANEYPEKIGEEAKKAEVARKSNPFQKGHVNHVNVEEVYDEPNIVIGTFLLNSFPELVLFDTAASHSFISNAFVDRNRTPTRTSDKPIKVSSPWGEMIATFACHQLGLRIGDYNFPTSLIVLETQGLDVILGTD